MTSRWAWHRVPWGSLGLVTLVWVVYAGGLANGFHYDDTHSIVENPAIRTLSHWARFFTDPTTFSAEPRMAMYRPLLVTSFAVDYAVHGLHPRGYHLVNLALHSLTVLLVYGLLRQQVGAGLSLWAAALFGVHPVHTQTVEYISSRSELAAGLGVLGAVYLYTSGGRLRNLAPGVYAAGLLCKSTAIAVVPLLFLYDVLHGEARRAWRRQWAYWLITGAYFAVVVANGYLGRSLGQDVRPYGIQLANQIKASVVYLGLFILPVHLSLEHAFIDSSAWWNGPVVAAGLMGASLGLAILGRGGLRGRWGLGWVLACSALTFLVPLNVQVNEQRLYLPSVGASMLVAVLVAGCRPSMLLRGLGAALVAILALMSWERTRVWGDDLVLWSDAVHQAPGSFRAQSNFGLALYEKGNLDAAEGALERALTLNPRYGRTWNNLGLVREAQGRMDGAESAYRRATALDPGLAEAQANLGRLLLRAGKEKKALKCLEQAAEADPQSASVQIDLGLALQRKGDVGGAEAAFQRALEIDSDEADAWNDLGMLRAQQGRYEDARRALARALFLDPRHEEAQVNQRALELRESRLSGLESCELLAAEFPAVAGVWVALGKAAAAEGFWDKAAEALTRALELDPLDYRTYLQLGGVRRRAGRLDLAIATYRRAVEAGIRSAPVYDALTAAYAAAGRLPEALRSCRRALALDPADPTAQRHLESLLARTSPARSRTDSAQSR